MIRTLNELRFYIYADREMNGYHNQSLFKRWMHNDKYRFRFLKYLRIAEYLNYKKHHNRLMWIPYLIYAKLTRKYSIMLGYEIPFDTIGYGCRLPHSDFIINGVNKIGNYCSIMHNVVIADANPKKIGNGLFLGTNVVLAKNITIADGVQIAANSFVNKSCTKECMLIGGVPAKELKMTNYWYLQEPYLVERFKNIENKKKELGLNYL